MVRLGRETELRDGLNVLAAGRRELILAIKTPRPLRKPRSHAQVKEQRELRADAQRQVMEQLDAAARSRFRGRIAVELRLALQSGRHAAGLGPVVKAYLDVLKGPVVFDDATVDHLLVLREPPVESGSVVMVRCLPLGLFAAEYDRAFRVLPEYEEISGAPPAGPSASGFAPSRIWGRSHFSEHDIDMLRVNESQLRYIQDLDLQEADQLEEDPDACIELDLPPSDWELADSDVRSWLADHLERVIALGRGDWMTDQGLDARDRPGPAPVWLDEVRTLDAADVVELSDDGPGCVMLPAPRETQTPAGEAGWPRLAERRFVALRSSVEWRETRFRGPVGLDIALRGGAGRRSDVDNVARYILRGFEKAFSDARPDVAAFRVYRQTCAVSDVRVRVLPAPRLSALADAMDRARDVLHAERADRMRE